MQQAKSAAWLRFCKLYHGCHDAQLSEVVDFNFVCHLSRRCVNAASQQTVGRFICVLCSTTCSTSGNPVANAASCLRRFSGAGTETAMRETGNAGHKLLYGIIPVQIGKGRDLLHGLLRQGYQSCSWRRCFGEKAAWPSNVGSMR